MLNVKDTSSRAQKVPFDWKPSFNAHHTRMEDVCEVGQEYSP